MSTLLDAAKVAGAGGEIGEHRVARTFIRHLVPREDISSVVLPAQVAAGGFWVLLHHDAEFAPGLYRFPALRVSSATWRYSRTPFAPQAPFWASFAASSFKG